RGPPRDLRPRAPAHAGVGDEPRGRPGRAAGAPAPVAPGAGRAADLALRGARTPAHRRGPTRRRPISSGGEAPLVQSNFHALPKILDFPLELELKRIRWLYEEPSQTCPGESARARRTREGVVMITLLHSFVMVLATELRETRPQPERRLSAEKEHLRA